MFSGGAGQTINRKKKGAFLIGQADKHGRQHKRREGRGFRCLPTKGTENTQHGGPFLLKYTVLGVPFSAASDEREATRTCSGQNPKVTAATKKEL